MLIQAVIASLHTLPASERRIDKLSLQWFETGKRVMRKTTESGKELSLKFLHSAHRLQQDDVLYMDEHELVVVDILPCDVIVIAPQTMYEMASVCYEIGNKHLPLFYDSHELLVPFEAPLFRLLNTMGLAVAKDSRRLLHPLQTTVSPHGTTSGGSLFSKIMQLTGSQYEP